MIRKLFLNIWLNLKYFSRSYLLLAVILVILYYVFTFIPFIARNPIKSAVEIIIQMHVIVAITVASLSLLILNDPIKNRNLKLIITKPCPPEIWSLSCFLTVNLVSLALHLVIMAFALVSIMLHSDLKLVPYIYGWVLSFTGLMIFSSFILFLTSVIPPALAVVSLLILNNYYLFSLFDYCFKYDGNVLLNIFYKVIGVILYLLYLLIPSFFPLEKMNDIMNGNNVDWAYLCVFSSYAVITMIFYWLLSVFFVKQKNLI
jgi:hypothetical protein